MAEVGPAFAAVHGLCLSVAVVYFALLNFTVRNALRPVYRVAQKVSHYQESSLNRVKNRSAATLLVNYQYKMSTRMI